ncbi:CBM96 family carbohydrate-binding protein [Dyadobacter flavalbus]|nr:malectin domain-containing carbohydrate-binding protein [Dyadobacter flavalbus]
MKLGILLLSASSLLAQPAIEWDKIAGTSIVTSCSTSDGGAMLGSNVQFGVTDTDYFITKVNAAGVKEWEKTFVGNRTDELVSIIQTSDGGYLLGGTSGSNAGFDKSQNAYSNEDVDFWIIKISANGTKQWDKTYGGTRTDILKSMKQTTDGGYIIGGSSISGPSDVKTEDPKGEYQDYWVIKISSTGARQWDKTIGGSNYDELSVVDQTAGGGYILGGISMSPRSGDKTSDSKGYGDYWIVKLSPNGSQQWDRTIGGNYEDRLVSLEHTTDGGYLLSGTSNSGKGGDKSEPGLGETDFWIVKINSDGIKQWDKTLGGTDNETLRTARQTSDGGYIIAGHSVSGKNGNKTTVLKSQTDYWLVKLNANGTKIWDKSIGAAARSSSNLVSVLPAKDGGLLLIGNIDIYDFGNNKTASGSGAWIVKLVSESNTKKLIFSASSLQFINSGNTTTPTQSVNLRASSGTPVVTLNKSLASWLPVPTSSLGSLPFKVNPTGIQPGKYKAVVHATAPGYARAIITVNLQVNDVTTPPTLDPIGNKELLAGQVLRFTALATSALGQTKKFSLVNAPQGAAIDTSTGVFRWVTPQVSGTYQFNVKVSSNTTPVLTDEETITVKVTEPEQVVPIRINAGGGDYTTADGHFFEADRYFEGVDRTSSVANVDIRNTADDELYRSARSSESFSYNIPVYSGKMKVTLHFAEIYWGVYPGRIARPDRRKFSVLAEGLSRISNYSILTKTGGPLIAVKQTFEVIVTDGRLNLDFIKISDQPSVSAIEVEMLQPLYVTPLSPVADSYVVSTQGGANFGKEPNLQVESYYYIPSEKRHAYIKFSLAAFTDITSAKIRIYTQSAVNRNNLFVDVIGLDNDNWTETGITWDNAPKGVQTTLGQIDLSRKAKYFELDVSTFAMAQLASDKTVTFRVQDNKNREFKVEFNSRENAVYPPELIIATTSPVSSVTRLAAEEMPKETAEAGAESSVIYPNPVRTQFTLHIGNQHQEAVTLQLFNEAGRAYNLKTPEVLHAGTKAEISIADLSLDKGIYLLKVQSVSRSEVLKLMVVK